MAVFSVNQNRQFYVAKKVVSSTPSDLGDLKLGGDTAKTYIYFQHMGQGGLVRSDNININSITYAKYTTATKLARKLVNYTVTLDSTVSATPISGQDYILRILIRQYAGNSDNNVAIRFGAVHAYSGMTASDFYIKMAQSIVGNMRHEQTPLLKVFVGTASNNTEVTKELAAKTLDDAKGTLSGTYTKIVIEEVEQPWRLGVLKQVPVFFEVYPTDIVANGDDVIWGKAVQGTSTTTIGNGKLIADLEYFCMGERGDQYRNINWPNNIETKYLVDPTKQYNVLDIHYSFSDEGIGVQKSEKDITIVADTSVDFTTASTGLLDLLKAKGITVQK